MRKAFDSDLENLQSELHRLSGLVEEALSSATTALLDGDAAAAEVVINTTVDAAELRASIEAQGLELLALQNPVASDLRIIVSALKIVADLERMAGLAAHIAKVARLRYPMRAVPEPLVPTLARMAAIADVMVARVRAILVAGDVPAALKLDETDDEMDRLRRASFAELLEASWPNGVEAAVDVALLGRYYERIADHAVSIAQQVVYLETGHAPVP